jgi:Nucleotidyltransferase domain
VVSRIREEEPDTVGVFAFGSYATGRAEAWSDLDLRAVTLASPRVPYRTWFDGDLHVSVGASSTDELRRLRSEPAPWSLGFAVESPGVWLWTTASAVAAVGDPPSHTHPPGEPELEDFVEACGKAMRTEDAVTLRLSARLAGELAPGLVRDLGTSRLVSDRVDAVNASLALEIVPDGWRDDLPVVLGLRAASDAEVRTAVERLARGTLALLRVRAPHVDPQPELSRYLADGTLERHLGFAERGSPERLLP